MRRSAKAGPHHSNATIRQTIRIGRLNSPASCGARANIWLTPAPARMAMKPPNWGNSEAKIELGAASASSHDRHPGSFPGNRQEFGPIEGRREDDREPDEVLDPPFRVRCRPRRRAGARRRPGARTGNAERLFDLAGELGAADAAGVRGRERHQGELPALLLGRGARAHHRREEQSARRRAVRRTGRDLRGRHQGERVRALQAAGGRRAPGALQARRRPVDRDRRRSAGVHDQRQVPRREQARARRRRGTICSIRPTRACCRWPTRAPPARRSRASSRCWR